MSDKKPVAPEGEGAGWKLNGAEFDTKFYDTLRSIARARLRGERANHSISATALVHEALIKLNNAGPTDRGTMLKFAANAMRQILVDHARKRNAEKRGEGKPSVDIDEIGVASVDVNPANIVALDDILDMLAKIDPRGAKVVEMRFFGGLTYEEIAEAMGLSVRTVKNDWKMASQHLKKLLTESEN